jgi:hypothetical protein
MTEWIDDAFRVEQKKYGLWDSYDKDGKCIITALHASQQGWQMYRNSTSRGRMCSCYPIHS